MADRKATNKYYPPNWDPSKGSLNTYVGQHPLRSRARKLDRGILTVRFELPYDIYCGGCEKHVGTGVRYNAEKKRIGSYYSTPIFSFSMKCHLCSNRIEIHTNPKDSEYVIASGARKAAEASLPVLTVDLGGTGIERSVIEQLEHENIDRIKAQRSCATIRSLLEDNDKTWGDPYTRSKELRKIFREEGKLIKAAETNGKRIADKYSLSLNIKPFSEDDREALERMELQSRISAKSSRRDPSDSIFNSGGQSLKKSIKTKKNFKKAETISTLLSNLRTSKSR